MLMELILRYYHEEPLEPTKDMLVVIVCESAATAPRACALLKRVGTQAGTAGRLIYSWWTFAELDSAPLRQLAAAEAADADMLLIAAQEGPGLPEPVREWVHRWAVAGATPSRSRVLAAWLEPNQTEQGAARAVYSELKLLAELGWLDFIANGEKVRLDLMGMKATVRHLADAQRGGAPSPMPDAGPQPRAPLSKAFFEFPRHPAEAGRAPSISNPTPTAAEQ